MLSDTRVFGELQGSGLDSIIRDSLERAASLIEGMRDPAHNTHHMREVVGLAERLCDSMPSADRNVVKVAATWHDAGRLYEKDSHEKLGAEMARDDLIGRGAPPDFARKVYDAIVNHGRDMTPETLEGKIVRDADKLDYLGFHKWADPVESKLRLETSSLEDRHQLIEGIPVLRDEILLLEPSRLIFDEMFPEFMRNMASIVCASGSKAPELKRFFEELKRRFPGYDE